MSRISNSSNLINKQLLQKCKSYGISSDVFYKTSKLFFKDNSNSHQLKNITPAFLKYIIESHPKDNTNLQDLINLSDFSSPSDAYPTTKTMHRKFILHLGPTNSGKTFAALNKFSEAHSAIYCGPLRLLAHEVYERMNSNGISCNLTTGEERKESSEVYKWSSTIEMAPLSKSFDVAVIDEIQMIADKDRGWAWTNAVLGLQAKEIHICGEPSALQLIKRILKNTPHSIQVNEYKRLTPLTVLNKSLEGSFQNLAPGDCLVAFSRQRIFALKRAVETTTQLKAAVIYGSLPPEARVEQAKLFNDPKSDYEILVASDAIGMGLNLNIKRIVFESVTKYDGVDDRVLTVSEMKQIGGRAGRFKSHFPKGEVTTLEKSDLKTLHRQIKRESKALPSAGLAPSLDQIENMAKYLPNHSFSSLLSTFEDLSSLEGNYFLCNLRSLRMISDLIQEFDLSIKDRFIFVQAPCNARETYSASRLIIFAQYHSKGEECHILDHIELPTEVPKFTTDLKELEVLHKAITLYLWLGLRFPQTFVDISKAEKLKKDSQDMINKALNSLEFKRTKKRSRSMENIDNDDEEISTIEIEGHGIQK